MVAYCTTALAGGVCNPGDCSNRHDILRCEPCGRSFPADLLGQHSSGKKHLRNVAANNPLAPDRPPLPPSYLPNSQPVTHPSTSSSAIGVPVPIAADPRVTVSHESGLDFVIEETEIAGRTSFPTVDLAILVEKTEIVSSLSISGLRLEHTTDTPESCFTASASGEVIRRRKPRKILVSFQAPHAGTFRMSLQIVFSDNTRPGGEEFVVLRELRGRANSQHVSLPSTPSPAIGVPVPITSDPRVTVSLESGLDFVVEGTEIAGRTSFRPVNLAIFIDKTEVLSSLTISRLRLVRTSDTPESCFTASVSGEAVRRRKPRKILVSFQAPHAGTFRMSLQIVFSDSTRPSDEEFVMLRELRGQATLPDDHSTEEDDIYLDSEGTGISVLENNEVDFGIIGRRNGLNGPFDTSSSSLTINHARGFPPVTFVEARTRSPDGSDSSFRATFMGQGQTIRPGTKSTVLIEFLPEFEGQFEETLQLIFSEHQNSDRFAVSISLRAIAGSLEDHSRFESLNQHEDMYSPRSRSGQQIPSEKIIPLPNPAKQFRNLPEYELPVSIQQEVYSVTREDSYNNKAKRLIAALRPKELTMGTYAEYFTALLNVEEGHQLRDILDQRPLEVDVQTRGSKYFIVFTNKDEDLLPEFLKGDFVWLEDTQEDVYYDARITSAYVFERDHGDGSRAVLKIFLQVPTSFNLYHGAQFLIRFRLNRITQRRQHHALASSLAHLRRLLFPDPSDVKSIQHLSEGEVANLQLVNKNIGKDRQQLQTVVSILEQPKGSVPFIIFGPPGTGKTSTVVESIMQLVQRDASFKILACAPSNAAADLLVERLATAGLTVDQLLRLNAHSRDIKSIPEDVRVFCAFPRSSKLRTYRIVLTTCSSAALLRTLNIPAGHFSHIIIDEAAQADEPLALVSIAFFSDENTNVILAGDPHQLGPVIKSGPASDAGLGKSYLERLMLISEVYRLDTRAGQTIVDLQLNRRSHGAIFAWPNRYLYEDIMRAGASREVTSLLLQSDLLPKKGFPVVFHGIKGSELRKKHSPSYLNVHEASIVRDYCLRLTEDHEHRIPAEEIGVVAPYKAQVRAIRELLRPAGLRDVTVGSVELFQGQERKVIIFATTRSNSKLDKQKAMGFLQNRRRMNVAITRAQALLIVVGDPDVLGKDEIWRTFLNYACLHGGGTGRAPSWRTDENVLLPGYKVIPRPGGVVYGESYIDGESKEIYRHFSNRDIQDMHDG